jgi:hypothetical protein
MVLSRQPAGVLGGPHKEKNAVGLMDRASAGVKVLGIAASLGVCAPLVVLAILVHRDMKKRTTRMARLAATSLEPRLRAIRKELYNWQEEVTWGEMLWNWIEGTER